MEPTIAGLAVVGMARRNTLLKEAEKDTMTSCLARNEHETMLTENLS